MELNSVEEEIDGLLGKVGFYLQTYRSLDAFNLLQQAEGRLAGNDIQSPVKAAVYRLMADCQIQMGKMEEGINYLIQCYECTEDDDNKAAAAGLISTYYLQLGKKEKALDYAEKALSTAKAPELKSRPYQIQGAIAGNEGFRPRTKAHRHHVAPASDRRTRASANQRIQPRTPSAP